MVHVLTFGMTIEATRAHQTHDARLDRGPWTRAQLPVPGAHVPSQTTIAKPLLETASTTVNIVVTLTNLKHHGGHSRSPLHRVSPEETQVSRFKCQWFRTRGRDCGPAKSLIHVDRNESTAGCISDTNRALIFRVMRDSGIPGCVASTHRDGEYPRILLIMFLADVALSNSD